MSHYRLILDEQALRDLLKGSAVQMIAHNDQDIATVSVILYQTPYSRALAAAGTDPPEAVEFLTPRPLAVESRQTMMVFVPDRSVRFVDGGALAPLAHILLILGMSLCLWAVILAAIWVVL